jgi:hypothetical protein
MNATRSMRALVAVCTLLVVPLLTAAPSLADSSKSAGAATLIDAGSGHALASGGSLTTWTLQLPKPPKSNCSGDSAHDGYYVYTYLVSSAIDPHVLRFNPDTGPDAVRGQFTFFLIDIRGTPHVATPTGVGTGQVVPGTLYNFKRLRAQGAAGAPLEPGVDYMPMRPGSYNLGLACWNADTNKPDKFWNARLTFKADVHDPDGLVWSVVAGATTSPPKHSSRTTALVVVLIVVIAAVGVAITRRRSNADVGV